MNVVVERSERFGDVNLDLKPIYLQNMNENFCLEVSRKKGENCQFNLEVFVQDSEGKVVDCGSREIIFRQQSGLQTWTFTSFLQNSKLFGEKGLLRAGDATSLRCEFVLTLGTVSDKDSLVCHSAGVRLPPMDFGNCATTTKQDSPDSAVDLQTDLKRILDDGTLCDATLQVGSEDIQVHMNTLTARSPIFKLLFATHKKKTTSNTVSVTNLDADTVRRLLLYMYTSTIVDAQWENISNLYVAADKYQVLSLKQKWASFFEANLSTLNVCEVLLLADLHKDKDLKAAVGAFIFENDSEVFSTKAWEELEERNSLLASQTLREVLLKKREKALKN